MDGPSEPSLNERVRAALRVGLYSYVTEKAYVARIRRFILFHGTRHPAELGPEHVSEYLSHLAAQRKVAPATQNQALNALSFLSITKSTRARGTRGEARSCAGPAAAINASKNPAAMRQR